MRGAWSYRALTDEEWQWALDFVARGGQSLTVYPEYRRVLPDEEGVMLAGHVHPAFLLSTRTDSLRLPCFVVGPARMILPSFGAFTGGHLVRPEAGDAVHCVRQRTDVRRPQA